MDIVTFPIRPLADVEAPASDLDADRHHSSRQKRGDDGRFSGGFAGADASTGDGIRPILPLPGRIAREPPTRPGGAIEQPMLPIAIERKALPR